MKGIVIVNAINSSRMPAIKYQGPAQRFQLVNREDQASLVDDRKSELYFGSSPVSVEELSLASFSTMQKMKLPADLNADLPATEVAKSMPEMSFINTFVQGENLQIVDQTGGGRQAVDRVILQENPAKPGALNVYVELGPQGGMSSVMQNSNGLLTWEY